MRGNGLLIHSFTYSFNHSTVLPAHITPVAGPSSEATALSLGVPGSREPLRSLVGAVDRTPEMTVATALGATATGC